MNSWRPYPLLRLVFPLLAGIILECSFGSVRANQYLFPGFLLILLLFSRIAPLVFSAYPHRWISGVIINLFMLLAGYGIASQHRVTNDPNFITGKETGTMLATVVEPPARTAYGYKAIIRLVSLHTDHGWRRIAGKSLAYLKCGSGFEALQFGDYLYIRAEPDSISDNSNPHSFNYAKYLNNKGITHKIYADSWAWQRSNAPSDNYLRSFAFQCRDKLLDLLRANQVTGREFAVAAALLLGYTGELSRDLLHDYSASGAMHVLSVSGMHVGIIYLFFEFLLGFLNKNRWSRWTKAALLLTFIWFYAFLTGLSPCVFRSAAMLTLPILARTMNRAPNMYNVISASLIFILAVDPFLVLDVGFQLSYLAVTGLVVLYKPIYDLYVTSAWLPDKIWSVLAVSLAAQISTLPLTLYVFHQFPNYFLFANLIVVPLSSLIIYIGIVLFAVGSLPIVAACIAKVLVFLIWLLNSTIHFIEGLPWSTITGIHISSDEMVLLYVIILTGFLFLTLRKIHLLYLFLIAWITFSSLFLEFSIHRLNASRLIVFNVKKIPLFEVSHQNRAVVFYGNGKPNDGQLLRDNLKSVMDDCSARGIAMVRTCWLGNADRKTIRPDNHVPAFSSCRAMQFGTCIVYRLDRPVPAGLTTKLQVDYVIVTGNPRLKMADVVKVFTPRMVIIDGTNSRFNLLKWRREAAAIFLNLHCVSIDGAFEKEF